MTDTHGSLVFGVITEVPTEPDKLWWNLAVPIDIYQVIEDHSSEEAHELVGQVKPEILLGYRQPVFNVGEILILDAETGREVAYPGRKPSKWGVACEEFTDLDQAVARAKEVFESTLRAEAAADS